MNTTPLDLDFLAAAGSDSFALERAANENYHRERASMKAAEDAAEATGLLHDAGYSLQWQPTQRIGRTEVHTVRAYRSGHDPRGHAVYVGCACSRLRALQHLLDQRPDGVLNSSTGKEPNREPD